MKIIIEIGNGNVGTKKKRIKENSKNLTSLVITINVIFLAFVS